MMICYTGLTKLKTKPIVFQDVFLASDSSTLEQLMDMSSKRKMIEESINENSHLTEAIAREVSGGLTSHCEQDIQKLENYLPLLENLIHQVNSKGRTPQMNSWILNLKIRWSSVLTSSSIFHVKGPKFHQVNDLYFELGMILFLYGAMLRERALEVLSSDLVQSAALFRRAAGVYRYLADEILVYLVQAEEKPPEVAPYASTILSFICLAEAQAVTARKAEENNSRSGLLAKLHYGITEFLVETIDLLQATNKECKDTTSRLLDYVLSCKTLHELQCYKYMADDLKNEGKIGAAIGVLRLTLASSKKNVPKAESWKSVYKQAVNESAHLLRKYEHENEFVWHDKIPHDDELPLPMGVKIVNSISYQPQKLESKLAFKTVQ